VAGSGDSDPDNRCGMGRKRFLVNFSRKG
jgi:hypothetical protein